MNGKCQVQNVVYKCTMSATPNLPKQLYLSVAETKILQPQKVDQEQKLYELHYPFKLSMGP